MQHRKHIQLPALKDYLASVAKAAIGDTPPSAEIEHTDDAEKTRLDYLEKWANSPGLQPPR